MANDCKKKKTKTSGTTRKAKSVPGKGCKEVETDESGPDTRAPSQRKRKDVTR